MEYQFIAEVIEIVREYEKNKKKTESLEEELGLANSAIAALEERLKQPRIPLSLLETVKSQSTMIKSLQQQCEKLLMVFSTQINHELSQSIPNVQSMKSTESPGNSLANMTHSSWLSLLQTPGNIWKTILSYLDLQDSMSLMNSSKYMQ